MLKNSLPTENLLRGLFIFLLSWPKNLGFCALLLTYFNVCSAAVLENPNFWAQASEI